MIFFKNISFVIVLLFLSCNSTNKSTSSNSEAEIKLENTTMIEDGFIMGTIQFSKKEGDCPITIEIEGKNGIYYYDPINLTEEYKKEGEKIWFKFAGLRRMNRCDKASPVNITEIKKRN